MHILAYMQLLKKTYGRKRIESGCSVRIENKVTQDKCSASRGFLRTVTLVTDFSVCTALT